MLFAVGVEICQRGHPQLMLWVMLLRLAASLLFASLAVIRVIAEIGTIRLSTLN